MSSKKAPAAESDTFDLDFDLDLGDGVVSSNTKPVENKPVEPKKSSA